MEVKDSDKPKTCLFCNQSEDNDLQYGKFYELDGDIVTHYYCLLLSSNMEQNGGDSDGILGFLREDIMKELRRGKRLTCSYCRTTGATLGCCVSRCKKVFHLPCGRRAGSLHQFFGQFKSFCASHRPLQKIDVNILQQSRNKEATCPICYEDVDALASKTTLWAPCCRVNAWFHRDCVQRLAMSAGYFFKCPLCNNKATFQKAMLDFGIYIPEQDASWELVPNAYQELLHRHKRCDATRCHCPKGRTHEMTGTRWELVLCKFCGSQGVHIGCGQLKWSNPEWECDECKVMLEQAREHPNSDYEGEQQEETPTVSGTAPPPLVFRRNRRTGRRRYGRRPRNVVENSSAVIVEESSSSRTPSPIIGPVSPPTPVAVVELSDDDDVVEILDDNIEANNTNENVNNGPVVLTSDGKAIPVVQVPSIPLIPEGEDFCVVGDLNVKMPLPQQTSSTSVHHQPSRTLVSNSNPSVSRSAVMNNVKLPDNSNFNNRNNVTVNNPRSQTASINSFMPITHLCDDKPKPAGLLKVTYSNMPSDGDQPIKRIRVSDPMPVSKPVSSNVLKTYLSETSQNLQPKQQQQQHVNHMGMQTKNQQPQSVRQSGLMAMNQQKQTEMMMKKQQQQSRIIPKNNQQKTGMVMVPQQQQTGMMVMQNQQDVNQSGMVMMSQPQPQAGMVMVPQQSTPQTSVLRGQTLAQPALMMMMSQQQLAHPVRGQSVMNQPTMMMVQQPPAMPMVSPSSSSAAVHGGVCSSAAVPGAALCAVKLCADSATTTSPAATNSQQCHRSHRDRENCHEQRDDGRHSDNRVIPSNLSLSDLRFKLINSNTLQMVLCDNFAIRFGIVTNHYKSSGSNQSSQNMYTQDKNIVTHSGRSNIRRQNNKNRVPMEYRKFKKKRNFYCRNKRPSSSRQRERSPSISRSYAGTLSRGRARMTTRQSTPENINSLASLNGCKYPSHSKQLSRFLSPPRNEASCSTEEHNSESRTGISESRAAMSKSLSLSGSSKSRNTNDILEFRNARSKSVSPSRNTRSRSVSPTRNRRSRSVSPSRNTRSRSVSPTINRRSRSVSSSRNTRSRSVSPTRNTESRSVSPTRNTRSRSVSPSRNTRPRSVSLTKNRRSRIVSPSRNTRSRSVSPTRNTRSRSVSPTRNTRSRSVSPSRNTRSQSVPSSRTTRSQSVPPSRTTRSQSVPPSRNTRSRSVPQPRNTNRSVPRLRKTKSRNVCQLKQTRSRSMCQSRNTRFGSVSQSRNTRSTSMPHLRNIRTRSVSLARYGRSRSMSLSKNRKKLPMNENASTASASGNTRSRSISRLSNPGAVSVSESRNKRVETSRNKRTRSLSMSKNKRIRSTSTPRIPSGNLRKEDNNKKRNRIDSERSSRNDRPEKSEFHPRSSKRARKNNKSWTFDTVDISLHTMVLTRSKRERQLRSLKGRKRAFSSIITNPSSGELLFRKSSTRGRSVSGDSRTVPASNQKISNTQLSKSVEEKSEFIKKLKVQDRTSISSNLNGAASADTLQSSNRQRSRSESSTTYVRSVVTRSQSKPFLRSKRVKNRSPSFEYPQLTPHSRTLTNTKNRQTRKSLPQPHSPRSQKSIVEKENQKQTRLEGLRLHTSLRSQKSVIENKVQNTTLAEQTSVEAVRSQISVIKKEATTSHKFGGRVRSKSESKNFDCRSQQLSCCRLNTGSERLKLQNGVRMIPSNSTLVENIQKPRTRSYSWSSETGVNSFEEISLPQKNISGINTVQCDTNTEIALNRTKEINNVIKDKRVYSNMATNNTVKSHEGSSFCVDMNRFLNDLEARQTEDYIVRMKAKALAARKFRPASRTEDLQRKMMKELQSLYKSEKS